MASENSMTWPSVLERCKISQNVSDCIPSNVNVWPDSSWKWSRQNVKNIINFLCYLLFIIFSLGWSEKHIMKNLTVPKCKKFCTITKYHFPPLLYFSLMLETPFTSKYTQSLHTQVSNEDHFLKNLVVDDPRVNLFFIKNNILID